MGNQWGRKGDWLLLISYGTQRYRNAGHQLRREEVACVQWEMHLEANASAKARASGCASGNFLLVSDQVALVATLGEAPDTGGSSSSHAPAATAAPQRLNQRVVQLWGEAAWKGLARREQIQSHLRRTKKPQCVGGADVMLQ